MDRSRSRFAGIERLFTAAQRGKESKANCTCPHPDLRSDHFNARARAI